MKKILMVLCSMLLSVSLNVNAQSVANKVLSSLTFEAPKARSEERRVGKKGQYASSA